MFYGGEPRLWSGFWQLASSTVSASAIRSSEISHPCRTSASTQLTGPPSRCSNKVFTIACQIAVYSGWPANWFRCSELETLALPRLSQSTTNSTKLYCTAIATRRAPPF
jgi:hypothetical protein